MAARKLVMLGLMVGVALLMATLTAPRACAAGKDAKERAARKACLSGDYAKGVEILSDLYIDTRDATYIFNQARCFEQNGHCEDAIARFREYLRKAADLSPENRADTEKHIADCQAVLTPKPLPEAGRESASAGVQPAPLPAASLPPSLPPPTAGANLAASTATTAHPGRGLRIGGLVCGVLGLAAIGTGIYFYTRATYYSDKVSGQEHWNATDENAGKNAETLQWVFYGTGAAALVTGTVLYWAGWQSADGSSTVGVAPLAGRGLAGISARGAF